MHNDLVFNAKQSVQAQYLGKPGIVGVGVGFKIIEGEFTGEKGVTVLVRQKMPISALRSVEILPAYIHSIPIDVVQVGHIRISPPGIATKARTDKWRPAPGGVSIGHYQITAGTLGTVVKEKSTGLSMILSNNHVLANSNKGKFGDDVFQPGPYDGGSPADLIGQLNTFVKIDFGQTGNGNCPLAETYAKIGNLLAELFRSKHVVKILQINPRAINRVDAALALPINDSAIENMIIDIGIVNGFESATLGMEVTKSGRTTATTNGTISLIHATVIVDYGAGNEATFENQVLTGPMSQGGDSGSLLVSSEGKKAVGLLFAGSSQVTIYNPMNEVLDVLNIEI